MTQLFFPQYLSLLVFSFFSHGAAEKLKPREPRWVCLFCSVLFFFLSSYHNCQVFLVVMLRRANCLWRLWVSAAVMRLGHINSADSQKYDKSWHFDSRHHRVTDWYDKSISFYLPCKHKPAGPLKAARGKLMLNLFGWGYAACHSLFLCLKVRCHPCEVISLIWAAKHCFSKSFWEWGEFNAFIAISSFFFPSTISQPRKLHWTHSYLPSFGGEKDVLC